MRTLRLLPDGTCDPNGCEHLDSHYQPDCNRAAGTYQVLGRWLCWAHQRVLDQAQPREGYLLSDEFRRLLIASRNTLR